MLVRELADDDVVRICRFYADHDDRGLYEFESIDELRRWVDAQKRPPSSVTLWGVASRWTFQKIEDYEESLLRPDWIEAGQSPALGYMVAEDADQLLWLVYKTLYYRRLRPSLPDFLLMADQGARLTFGTRGNRTIVAPYDNPDLIRQPLDLAMVMAHGKSFDAFLQKTDHRTLTLCSRPTATGVPARTENPPDELAVCHVCAAPDERCFRDDDPRTPYHERLFISELQARILVISACASWRLHGELAAGCNLAIRSLDSCCTAYIGSRYEIEWESQNAYLVLAAWKAGFSLGEILRLLSPGRIQLFSLIGDPEQRRMRGIDPGCSAPLRRGGFWELNQISEGLFSLPKVDGGSVPLRVETTDRTPVVLGYAVPLQAPHEYDRGHAFFGVSGPEVVRSSPLRLRPDSPPPEPPWVSTDRFPQFADQQRLFAELLGLDAKAAYEDQPSVEAVYQFVIDSARKIQETYGPKPGYWPGPFRRSHLECWRTVDGPVLRGHCFACGLPTMHRTVLVQPFSAPWRGAPFSPGVACEERFCPKCYQISHLPAGEPFEFDVDPVLRVKKPFTIRVRRAPRGPGVSWPAAYAIERPYVGHNPGQFPLPQRDVPDGYAWVFPQGLAEPGLHFVRLYYCRVPDLTLCGIGTIVHAMK